MIQVPLEDVTSDVEYFHTGSQIITGYSQLQNGDLFKRPWRKIL